MSSAPEESGIKKIFIICPIKSPGSETRKRSDQVKKYIIDPIASEKGYTTIRSDGISKPGRIDSQIIEKLINDDLVIADISEQNPNVFYELAVRHAIKKPVILIGQKGGEIPFDVSAQRIIFYDVRDLDSVEEAKDELERQINAVESDEFIVDSPIREIIPLENIQESDVPSRDIQEVLAIVRNQNEKLSNLEDMIEYSLSKRRRDEMERIELDRLNENLRRSEMERNELINRIQMLEDEHQVTLAELLVTRERLEKQLNE